MLTLIFAAELNLVNKRAATQSDALSKWLLRLSQSLTITRSFLGRFTGISIPQRKLRRISYVSLNSHMPVVVYEGEGGYHSTDFYRRMSETGSTAHRTATVNWKVQNVNQAAVSVTPCGRTDALNSSLRVAEDAHRKVDPEPRNNFFSVGPLQTIAKT